MRQIIFTPTGFEAGGVYNARLILGNTVIQTISNIVEDVPIEFEILAPGTYIVSLNRQNDGSCVDSRTIQAFFPLVTSSFSGVNCNDNTYTVSISLSNPDTAGANVQYGWSLLNNCNTVTNWNGVSDFIIQADDTIRYFFVRNESEGCCNYITQNSQSPCPTCNLEITNISFSCS